MSSFIGPIQTLRQRLKQPLFLASQVRSGNVQAIARAISFSEEMSPASQSITFNLLKKIFPYTGNSFILGITGPPGVGKSSLTNLLIRKSLTDNPQRKVACILVDPTNQFTGGSILGDRAKIDKNIALDPRVYIRSMAAGKTLGGLTHNIREAIAILEAAGYGLIIVETVGVGQSEIEIVRIADTIVLACQPGSGDSVQMIKSGINEIADVFAVTKADLGSIAEDMLVTVNSSLFTKPNGWEQLVLKTSTEDPSSIDNLFEFIFRHKKFIEKSGILAKKRKAYYEQWVKELVNAGILSFIKRKHPVDKTTEEALHGPITTSPLQVAREILKKSGIK